MATKFNPAAYNFRQKCPFVSKDLLRWFPGHMNKGLKQMQRKLKTVDCVIEVHDSRIPFTGRNPIFTNTLTGAKPHILVLNKKDLTVSSLVPRIKDQLKAEQGIQNIVFTNSKDQSCRGLKTLRPLMVDLIKDSNRYNRSEESDYNVMIIGVPNVGKSSLINMLRSRNLRIGHALPVGAIAGVTRSVLTKIRINSNPDIFMLDTPGQHTQKACAGRVVSAACAARFVVFTQRAGRTRDGPAAAINVASLVTWSLELVTLRSARAVCDDGRRARARARPAPAPAFCVKASIYRHANTPVAGPRTTRARSLCILEPSVTDIEMGLKLALCANLQDHLVGEEAIADYLLYWLNKHACFNYVDYMGLLEPCDDINKVLISGAMKYNRVRRTRDFDGTMRDVPDFIEVARMMIKAFRTGELGRTLLDIDLLQFKDQKHNENAMA
ncbi:hypothetical protein MSG28_006699 [Choristoneura fumiferana]|uniref:Uncharacterized protein n=1 Tax=Choristoneura fumiferana TaxID=7141 RepID=A0ACC0JKP5_CHOFU|nr:hypothetical protein MSG28_006699 [Choristoneura fumiferana]